jgi:hypothetical protein
MIVECHRCKARVDGKVIADHECSDEDDPAPFTTTLLECPQCSTTLVAGQYVYEDEPTRVWPSPQRYVSLEIPDEIRNSIEEATICFKAGAFNASTVMAGRALEAICRHFGSSKNMLGAGIKELREKGIIDSRLAEWAAELQKARNLSAHASGERTSREDAEDLLQFVSAICEYVFVLTRRFQRFMERKEKLSAKGPRRSG